MTTTNEFQQPVGEQVSNWTSATPPQRKTFVGRFCTVTPLIADAHATQLFEAYSAAGGEADWTYLPVGPFADLGSYKRWVDDISRASDPLHYAVIDNASGLAVGTLSLMRIDAQNGVIEMGWVIFSPRMKRTSLSTEAQFLLMTHVFEELGYRRYEWKCDSLNNPSRIAAKRLGFTYEGTFRQSAVVKGRSRDTAWFSITDAEWPDIKRAYVQWLEPSNFDENGQQKTVLKTHS